MRIESRIRPDSSPPSFGPGVCAALLTGGIVVIVLAVIAVALTVLTPDQALALGLVGLAITACGIGTGHEFELPTAWLRQSTKRGRRATQRDGAIARSDPRSEQQATFGSRA